MRIEDIRPHRYYSNGAYGRAWGVRLVREVSGAPDQPPADAHLSFKGVAGQCRRKTGECSLAEFAAWARYEVALNENSWQRVGGEAAGSEPFG